MTPLLRLTAAALAMLALTGCESLRQRIADVGQPPSMTPSENPTKDPGYRPLTLPMPAPPPPPVSGDSLWRPGSRAFFRDQRASHVGDLITVVVSMADSANVQNVTTTTRTSNEGAGLPNLFGLENAMKNSGMTPASLLSTTSTNGNTGNGQIQRNETVTLRLAGVVTQVLPNGNLVVEARQEFRVNSELRVLTVSGVVRPQDISSDNTITHDRMAEARISYGGRGTLTELQTPRWGQQMMDIFLPF
jgi:flagellar L-ring protein FlgH